jgi:hypothetical protein
LNQRTKEFFSHYVVGVSYENSLHLLFYAETTTDLGANTPVNCKRLRMKMGRNGLVSLYFVVSLQA